MWTCKIVELGIDLSGDEELMRAWYPHSITLPIIAPLSRLVGGLSVPLWLYLVVSELPRAVKGQTSYMIFLPVVGIPMMAFFTIKTFLIIGPDMYPSPEVLGELVQVRTILLLVSSSLLLAPILEFKVAIRGISKGLRKAASNLKPEASAEAIPEGMEIVSLMEPPLLELCCLVLLLTLSVADFGVVHTGDQALMAAWARKRDKIPTVLLAYCGIAVAAGCKIIRALCHKLPEALRQQPGSFAGCSPIVLVPALVGVWQFSELSKFTAVLKSTIVFTAMCCTMVELGIVMKDVTHALVPVADGAGAKHGEKVE